ncbi:MAG: glycosyltransferase [Mucilaginibacter sp.]|uniref:glycosyltransferase family 32 protein n=1 Tax=Mucilaginibacter sp. TaxID=1882438 RepID=UPI0031AA25C1
MYEPVIPKVLHQTWKSTDVPEHFAMLTETWKEHHPDWEYNLWTDKTNREFIGDYWPGFIAQYDSYTNNIQRVDAVRYLILLKFGGVYVDIDFECLMNIEPLLQGKECVFGLEPKEHAQRFSKDKIICNAFMASIPGHDFFAKIYENLSGVKLKDQNTVLDILESTGPFLLSKAYEEYEQKQLITLLPPELIYPLTIEDSRMVMAGDVTAAIEEKIMNSYAVHYFWGNWWESIGIKD